MKYTQEDFYYKRIPSGLCENEAMELYRSLDYFLLFPTGPMKLDLMAAEFYLMSLGYGYGDSSWASDMIEIVREMPVLDRNPLDVFFAKNLL